MSKERSAGAVIFRKDGKKVLYLLLHYHFKSDYWDFPKGNIEKGEAEEDTVKREVNEETGISDIKLLSNFKEKVSYFYRKDNETVFKEVVFFLAETKTEDVKISSEHTGFEWIDYESAIKKLKRNSKNVLMKANDFLSKRLSNFL
mgnify:CR=1 FL=1